MSRRILIVDDEQGIRAALGQLLEYEGYEVKAAANAVDGNANSYWESRNNAFPQSVTVDLGAAKAVKRLVLKLPPAPAWATGPGTAARLG